MHWILLAFGYGVFGVGLTTAAAISLAYCTDCYQDVSSLPLTQHPLLPRQLFPARPHASISPLHLLPLPCTFPFSLAPPLTAYVPTTAHSHPSKLTPFQIIGDALVGIVFTRNVFSVIVLFTITPWITGMGVQNLHILTACLAFTILMVPAVLLKWGKKARLATAGRYERMARRQPTHRTF